MVYCNWFFLLFFKGGDFILKFKKLGDIESIYNIVYIKDEYILTKENENFRHVYIYEINPIPIINISNDIQKNISSVYTTFLREINVDFQVLVINKKIDFNQVFNSNKFNQINSKYFSDMRVKIKDDKIYYSKYYLIVALKKQDQVENIDKMIDIFKNCGCNVKRIIGKNEIELILYECINKREIK